MTMATAEKSKKERPSALRSIIAGSTAGAVEIGQWFSCTFLAILLSKIGGMDLYFEDHAANIFDCV